MGLFIKYIKQHHGILIILAIFCVVFAATFALYNLPVEAVLYPTAICAVIGIITLIICFSARYKKRKMLSEARKSMFDTMLLPKANGICEEEYLQITEKLQDDIRKLLDEKNETVSDMTDYYTMWVHQIKTPIASMKLTLQSEDSPASRRISSELNKIEQYVEMVMAYIRLGSETGDYVLKEYRIDDIIRSSLRNFSSDFISKKLKLDFKPTEITLITDEKWLSFVIGQIISNSLKYTKDGGISIYSEDKTLVIADTGIGIASEDLPLIFSKGYTGNNGRDEKKSSGIGLYLCKQICDKLNLSIKAESEIGKGTKIKINTKQHYITE